MRVARAATRDPVRRCTGLLFGPGRGGLGHPGAGEPNAEKRPIKVKPVSGACDGSAEWLKAVTNGNDRTPLSAARTRGLGLVSRRAYRRGSNVLNFTVHKKQCCLGPRAAIYAHASPPDTRTPHFKENRRKVAHRDPARDRTWAHLSHAHDAIPHAQPDAPHDATFTSPHHHSRGRAPKDATPDATYSLCDLKLTFGQRRGSLPSTRSRGTLPSLSVPKRARHAPLVPPRHHLRLSAAALPLLAVLPFRCRGGPHRTYLVVVPSPRRCVTAPHSARSRRLARAHEPPPAALPNEPATRRGKLKNLFCRPSESLRSFLSSS